MNPHGPGAENAHAGGMEPPQPPDEAEALATFQANLETWLDDEEATAFPEDEVRSAAGTALGSMFSALAEARSHESCPKDTTRTVDIIVKVAGVDGVLTLQRIPPGVNPGCVLQALSADPQVGYIEVMGWAWATDRLPEPGLVEEEPAAVVVTSEVPGMTVTYEGGPLDLDADESWSPDLATTPPPLAPYVYAAGVLVAGLVVAWAWRRRRR